MCGKLVDNTHKLQKEIGTLFGINSRTVSSVIKGTHWKHIQRTPLVGGL